MGDVPEQVTTHDRDALLELGLATIDMTSNEKWSVEQLLIAYVADSVPPEVWTRGIDVGVRAVRRARDGVSPDADLHDQ